jgi:hypothetical protein
MGSQTGVELGGGESDHVVDAKADEKCCCYYPILYTRTLTAEQMRPGYQSSLTHEPPLHMTAEIPWFP